jgi:signal transduction histidine kinase
LAFQPQSLLFFIPALINLGIVLYILIFLPRGRTVDLFAICVLALSLWQIEEGGYMYISNPVVAYRWDKLLCFSWILINPVGLHFAFSYTRHKLASKRHFLVITYFPFLLLHGLYISGNYNHLQHDSFWGWVIAPGTGWIDALMLWLMAATMFVITGMLLRYALRLGHCTQRRKQAFLVGFGILIPTFMGFVTQVLFPLVLGLNEMPLSPVLVTFFSLSTIIALVRYRLFDISESLTLETVLHQIHNIVLAVLPDREVQSLNRYTTSLFAQSKYPLLHLQQCFENAEAFEDFDTQVLTPAFQGHTLRNNMVTFCAGNQSIDTLVAVEPVRYRNKVEAVLIVANDITEYLRVVEDRKQAEKLLEEQRLRRHRDITEAVLAAQENERRVIGAELHDNVNQILTSAKLYLGLASAESKEVPFLGQADNIIGKAMSEVRKLSHALIPPSWSGETLEEALRHLLSAAEQGGLFEVKLDVNRLDEEGMPPKVKLAIYRIVQEQINNIIKHAQAKTVRITLQYRNKDLVLQIHDDGKGFNMQTRSLGIGLKNIETRVLLHDGRMQLVSEPGQGCLLEVHFPLYQADAPGMIHEADAN